MPDPASQTDPETVPNRPLRTGLRLAPLFLPLVGGWGIGFLSYWGIGTFHDTFHYLFGARSLVEGQGLLDYYRETTRPLTHFPPLLSILLAGLSHLGLTFLDAGRWLNMGLFACNIFLAGLLTTRLTQNRVLGGLGALLVLVAPGMVHVHSYILSEPPYLACTLSGLYFLALYLTETRLRWALLSGLLLGLGFWARYVGGTLVITALLAVWFWGPVRRAARLSGMAVVGMASGVLILPVLLRNWMASGNLANRSLDFQWPTQAHYQSLVYSLRYWFGLTVDAFPPPALLWFLLGAVAVGTILLSRLPDSPLTRWLARTQPPLPAPLSLFCLLLALWGFGSGLALVLPEASPERWLIGLWPGNHGWIHGQAALVGLLVWATLAWVTLAWKYGAGRPHSQASSELMAVNLLRVLMLHAGVYCLLLFVSLVGFDHGTRLLLRILTPVQIVGLLVVLGLFERARTGIGPGSFRAVNDWLVPVAFGLVLMSYALYTWSWVEQSRRDGIVYFTRSLVQSSVIQSAGSLPQPSRVYSNEPVMLSFLLDRPIRPVSELPPPPVSMPADPAPVFAVEIQDFDLERADYDMVKQLEGWQTQILVQGPEGRVLRLGPARDPGRPGSGQ